MENGIQAVKEEMKRLMVSFVSKTGEDIGKRACVVGPLPSKEIKNETGTDRRVKCYQGDQQKDRKDHPG